MLGPERCAQLEAVTIDMSGAYIKAVTNASPQAQLIFDRFHVQRLAHNALDEVRREEVREASTQNKAELKNTRWALHKNPWNLHDFEREKVAMVQRAPLPRSALFAARPVDAHRIERRANIQKFDVPRYRVL